MKLVAALLTTAALTATAAGAFEPIAHADVKGLVGKQVWAAANKEIGTDDVYVYAGQAVTVVAAEQFGDPAEGERYNFVKVKTADGKEGQVQLRFLSKKPLAYDLTSPGKAKDLLVKAFHDAYDTATALHALRSKHDYEIGMTVAKDGKQVVNPDYDRADAMAASFEFSKGLVHDLIYSTNHTEEQLMRDGQTKWVATAKDDTILAWMADGIKDPAMKRKLSAADNALSALNNVSSFGFRIAAAERDRKERAWVKGMDGVPEDKLKKLDQKNVAEIDKTKADSQKKIKEAFDEAKKLKKQLS